MCNKIGLHPTKLMFLASVTYFLRFAVKVIMVVLLVHSQKSSQVAHGKPMKSYLGLKWC